MSATRRHANARPLTLLLVATVAGCSFESCRKPKPDIEGVVSSWLECIDCTEGNLDSVVVLATRTSAVVDTLAKRLTNGPPSARLTFLKNAVATAFVRDTAYANRHNIAVATAGLVDSTTHVNEVVRRATMTYRGRAAIALGCVHSSAAQAAIASIPITIAAAGGISPELRDKVNFARDSLNDPAVRAKRCRS